MSNYSKTTDFAAKDSLPSGDSGKIIRGSEFETEFDNISTAIATKADAADPTFTGTVTIDGLTVNGNTTLGNAATDTVTVTADIASNLIPSADDTYNLGASGAEWNDLFIDGTANIDSLVADTADINGGTIDGVTIGGSSAGAITGTTITGTSFVTSGDMTFGDNDKAVFGAGSDLQIYHNGSQSFLTDVGTGNLYIQAADNVFIDHYGGTGRIATLAGGGVQIKYDGVTKLQSTSTGVDVTGTVVSDGLTVDGQSSLNDITTITATNPRLRFIESDTTDVNTDIRNSGGDFQIGTINDAINFVKPRFNIDHATGDVSFYEDTGTTAKFFWDASAESLGIGTTSPSRQLHVQSNGPDAYLRLNSTGNNSAALLELANDATTWTAGVHSSDTFVINNGASERMRIDSSGNVGIGTTSPTTNLDIAAASSTTLTVRNTSTVSSILLANGSSANQIFSRGANSSTGRDLAFVQGTSEAMRIDSGGNVGIGTDSPSRLLHVKDTSSQTVALFDGGGNAAGEIGFRASGTSGDTYVTIGAVANDMVLSAGANERMRITSGGHLLVGKTSQDATNTVGFEAKDDGVAVATTDGAQSLILNRKSSDGTIAEFRKDNSAVGQIGAAVGNAYYAGSATGITFGSANLYPTDNSGTKSDGSLKLGAAANRFSDLFLSGGVYLGGTAAANKLDDYEEGTFTPVFEPTSGSFTTMTMDVVQAKYTKVGNTVSIALWVRTDDVDTTGGTGAVVVSGLPFNADGFTSLTIGNSAEWAGDHPAYAFTSGGTDNITLQYKTAINGVPINLLVTDLQTGTTANQNQVFISGTYFTTA